MIRNTPLNTHSPILSRGFTIVEVSIVIVIIGLLIGGILLGQDLIKGAQLRSIMTEKEQYETAITAFEMKYNCMPGDCAHATRFLPDVSDGNGDGEVTWVGLELWYIGHHLSVAGLLNLNMTDPGDYSTYLFNGNPANVPGFNIPASKYPRLGYFLVWIASGAGQCGTVVTGHEWSPAQCDRHNITFWGGQANSGIYAGSNTLNPWVMPCHDLYRLDSKFDDGRPFTGQIVLAGHNLASHMCSPGSYPTGEYHTTSDSLGLFSFVTNID